MASIERRSGSAGGFVCTWDILDGLRRESPLTVLQVQKRHRKERWDCMNVCVKSSYFSLSAHYIPFPGGRNIKHAEVIRKKKGRRTGT